MPDLQGPLRRTLSSPVGWVGFLLLEAAVAWALFGALGLQTATPFVRWMVAIGILGSLFVLNYWIRRTFLHHD
jgi:putative flippase GtrA